MIQSISPRNMDAAWDWGESYDIWWKSVFAPEGRDGWRKLRCLPSRELSSQQSACRPAWRRRCWGSRWPPSGLTWQEALCCPPSSLVMKKILKKVRIYITGLPHARHNDGKTLFKKIPDTKLWFALPRMGLSSLLPLSHLPCSYYLVCSQEDMFILYQAKHKSNKVAF